MILGIYTVYMLNFVNYAVSVRRTQTNVALHVETSILKDYSLSHRNAHSPDAYLVRSFWLRLLDPLSLPSKPAWEA